MVKKQESDTSRTTVRKIPLEFSFDMLELVVRGQTEVLTGIFKQGLLAY